MTLFPLQGRLNPKAITSHGICNRLAAFTLAVLGLFAVLCVCGRVASAQVETGQLSGTVIDQSGAVVPGAGVAVKNLGTNYVRNSVTSSTGNYLIVALEPALYEVTITSGNFKAYTAKVEITPGSHLTLDAKLSVSAAVTEVEVVGEGGAQVNTQTQEISQVVSVQQVQQLPSLTRNPYDFVAVAGNISNGDAGSSGSGTGAQSNMQNSTTRGVGFDINGQRSTGTEILLDGVENISVFSEGIGIFIPQDAMQEYTVDTSNFLPQYGRASGGVVNVTTKAGSNAFHGNTWEYNRISAFTSNTETNDQEGNPKGVYTRNQFGFDVGGPVMKNKLFFFGSGEWIKVRSAAVVTSGIPTSQFLADAPPNIQSFFTTYGSGAPTTYSQTFTASQVYGATLPSTPPGGTALSPSTPVFGIVSYQAPTNAGGGVPQNTYNFVARGDYNPSEKSQMFFRFVDYKEVDTPGGDFASPYAKYDVGGTDSNQAYLYNFSHQFTPAFVANTKLSFSRFNTFYSYNTALQNVPTLDVAVNATIPTTGTLIQLPGFYDTNPANGGLPYGGPQNTSQINQDLDWVKGRHSIQTGVQLVYIQDNNAYGAYAQATEQLGISRSAGLTQLYQGNNMYEFEAAVNPKGALPCVKNPYTGVYTPTAACSITLPASSPSFARSDRFKEWAGYAQDAWKVTPQLTFDYGLRYEFYGVQHNNNHSLDSNYYYGSGTTLGERIRNGQMSTTPKSPIGNELWKPSYGTFSPRIGFAYDVFGNGRDSVRGGFGISYERNFGNVTFNVIQNPPTYAVIVINNTPVTNSNAGPLAGSSAPTSSLCYPAACLPPTSGRWVDQNIRTSQTQFWSLAIEHELTHNTVASIDYVGAHGVHLYDIKNFNGLGSGNVVLGDPYTDPVSGNSALTRLNNQYSNINNRGSDASSHYQGVNFEFQSTNVRQTGLGVVANYTFSHQLDDLSTTFSETNNEFSLGYTNPFNPSMDWGSGDLDVRNRLVVAPMYTDPYFKDQSTLLGETLGGWQASAIYIVHSGTPFSYYDFTNNATGYNVARYTPDGPLTQHKFNSIPRGAKAGVVNNTYTVGTLPGAAEFGNPALGGISDWGPWPSAMTNRNSFRGPGFWNVDMAVAKTFPIHEKVNLEFRAEGFNILNHHNLFLLEGDNDASSEFATTDSQGNNEPLVLAAKGGIGNGGGANDERRFGQFALRINF
jgi:outer membrane receptor protein involved in Fe transport